MTILNNMFSELKPELEVLRVYLQCDGWLTAKQLLQRCHSHDFRDFRNLEQIMRLLLLVVFGIIFENPKG